MSDTPRTEAAVWKETNQANSLALASFSREIERENKELTDWCRELLRLHTVEASYFLQTGKRASSLLTIEKAVARFGLATCSTQNGQCCSKLP